MMNNKENFDDVFEVVLKKALKEVASEPDNSLPDEIDIEFSEEHKMKMKKMFDREKKRIWRKRLFKSMQRVAACLLVFILISGVTIMSVSALRIRFMNFVFNTEQTNTKITGVENIENGKYDTDTLSLDYIPVGFALKKQNISEDMIYLMFGDEVDRISISFYTSDGTASIDTENANCEEMIVNGKRALYSNKKNLNILTILDDDKTCIIEGTVSKEEIMKIARNLKKK